MLQMDMTAWCAVLQVCKRFDTDSAFAHRVKAGTEPTIGIITDFVDPDFTDLIRKVVGEYAEIGFTDTKVRVSSFACRTRGSFFNHLATTVRLRLQVSSSLGGSCFGMTELTRNFLPSDHASWSKIGAPSAFTSEQAFSLLYQ